MSGQIVARRSHLPVFGSTGSRLIACGTASQQRAKNAPPAPLQEKPRVAIGPCMTSVRLVIRGQDTSPRSPQSLIVITTCISISYIIRRSNSFDQHYKLCLMQCPTYHSHIEENHGTHHGIRYHT